MDSQYGALAADIQNALRDLAAVGSGGMDTVGIVPSPEKVPTPSPDAFSKVPTPSPDAFSKVPIPSPDAFSHERVLDWIAALNKVGLPLEPLEAAHSRRSVGRFAAIPFADDDQIDSYALGFAGVTASGRSPPGGDAML